MREGRASRTAEQNALFRALESSLPPERRLFHDPLARCFLKSPLALVARLGAVPGLRVLVPRIIDRHWPGVRSSVVARTASSRARTHARSGESAGPSRSSASSSSATITSSVRLTT